MDACFVYIYQYEPYLRDPVSYPKVQVRGQVGGGPQPCCAWGPAGPLGCRGQKQHKSNWLSTNGIYCPTKKSTDVVFRYGWIQEPKASSVSGLCFLCMCPTPRWCLCGMAETALGSTRLPFSLFSHLRGGRALNSSVLKCKSQVGSHWPSLSHMLIADYYGQGGGMF